MEDGTETAVPRMRAPRPTREWKPAPPKSAIAFAVFTCLVVLAMIGFAFVTAHTLQTAIAELGETDPRVGYGLYAVASVSLLLIWPAICALLAARTAAARLASDLAESRAINADAREHAWIALGWSAAVAILLIFGQFLVTNDVAVGRTFFDVKLILETFGLVAKAFWVNVEIFVIAEMLVLVWGLLIAVARLAPGRAGAPVRFIATAYVDLFRGLPAIIAIYLVGFGLPLALPISDFLVEHFPEYPDLRDGVPTMLAILALTLTYGAYVSEVYRAGIESVHWSQTAAARSLGFSHGQTLRFVVVPQAVRRIIPPLLNDFISLQKDTALVSVIGTVDAFNQAKIIASNHFNLSSVTTVAVLFVLITIPQGRLVDKLIERDQKRMRSGS